MEFIYNTEGVCSRRIFIEIDDDDRLVSVRFEGGCNGNAKGVGALCEGMKIEEVIRRLSGIRCGFKPTSCPDQLAKALMAYQSEKR